MNTPDPYSQEGLQQAYDTACAERDAREAKVKPLREAFDAARNEAEKHRVLAMEAKARLMEGLGGHDYWFALKKRIGQLARSLGGK